MVCLCDRVSILSVLFLFNLYVHLLSTATTTTSPSIHSTQHPALIHIHITVLSPTTALHQSPHLHHNLRRQPSRITRKRTRQPNIRQTQPKRDNPLQAHPTPSMLPTPVPECLDIVLQSQAIRVDGWVHAAHAFAQKVVLVDTLCAGQDLLAAHVEVVAVAVAGRV